MELSLKLWILFEFGFLVFTLWAWKHEDIFIEFEDQIGKTREDRKNHKGEKDG